MKEREQEERRSIKKCLLRFPYIDKGENNWIPEKKKVEEKEEGKESTFSRSIWDRYKMYIFPLLLLIFFCSFVQLIFLPLYIYTFLPIDPHLIMWVV